MTLSERSGLSGFEARLRAAVRDRPWANADSRLRRLSMQIRFAAAFAAALGRDHWQAQVAEAHARVAEFDPGDGANAIAALAGLSDRIETDLAEIGRAAKDYTIHCVGHGHIDMNWMWNWPETVATTHDTFASVLELMRQDPEFTYSQGQAAAYALIEHYHPAQFEEIQQRVTEGRWEVTAAHWVEGDKNLASGESLCRHLLLTRAYVAEKFGLSPDDQPVDWEPDTFGHALTIPTLVSQGGVHYYYACRLGGGFDHTRAGAKRPPLFWWEGPDGRGSWSTPNRPGTTPTPIGTTTSPCR